MKTIRWAVIALGVPSAIAACSEGPQKQPDAPLSGSGGTSSDGPVSSAGITNSASGGVTSSAATVAAVTSSSAGTTTGGAQASCSNENACGGDVVGTWDVASACINLSGALDPSTVGLTCTNAPVTGSLLVTGSFTANADGTYADNTVTSGSEEFTLDASCLTLSSTLIDCRQAGIVVQGMGFTEVNCEDAPSGGCSCAGAVQQDGSMGLLDVWTAQDGTYTVSGTTVTLEGGFSPAPYSYCVSGDTMIFAPATKSPTTTGTIVLQRQGAMPSTDGTTTVASTTNGATTGSGGAASSTEASTTDSTSGSGSSTTGGETVGARPCDVFAAAGTPCVAAHSTVRALFADYDQALYQVRRVSDDATQDIPVLAGSGVADASVQDTFCGTTTRACTISIIYDQTPNGNDLRRAEVCPNCSGCPSNANMQGQPDVEAFADLAKITIAGHTAYGVRILPCGGDISNQTGYRCTDTNQMATGDQAESVYFVVDGVNTNTGCCFDYGNASTDLTANGNMNAVEFSKNKFWGYGEGDGPWIAADLEAGVYAWNGGQGNWMNPNSLSLAHPFVTALLKNNQNGQPGGAFVLKAGDAQSGSLTTMWDGARPSG